ncbi:MAG: hypothetical protein CMG87_01250 [Marinobacter sp.]|nr:hypothetical protein [Marinobacter sp.]
MIEINGRRFLECEDDWEAEILEWQTIVAIFEYTLEEDYSLPDYDLEAILTAEDDDSPGVPEIGCETALTDLMERISNTEHSNRIKVPELKALLDNMERAFGREPLN